MPFFGLSCQLWGDEIQKLDMSIFLSIYAIICLLTLSVLLNMLILQANNMPVNIMSVGYTGQSHGQSSYSLDDLPKTVVLSLNQGSAVKSMDFHPVQQILLLG